MLALVLSLLVSVQAKAYIVISDVDDTIKITNSGDTSQAAWSGLFKKDVFPGMPDLYKAWNSDGAILYFVTASPSLLGSKIKSLLSHYEIAYASLTTRSNLLESKLKYKVRVFSKLMDRHPSEQVILVGDDVGQDPEVFAAIEAKYPGRVLTSYIRPVKAREALPLQIPYVTVYDIATHERREGRLGAEIIVRSTVAVMTGDTNKLFPKFAWCPTEIDGTNLPTDTSPYAAAERVEDRIESICRARQSGTEILH